MNIKLRYASPRDLTYVVALQRKFSNAVGFLPRAALDDYLAARRVILASQNGDPAAYLLFRPSQRRDAAAVSIIQAAVQLDSQRRHIGLALVQLLAARMVAVGKRSMSCKCATDLDSNAFWRAAGFVAIDSFPSLAQRGRVIVQYKKGISC